MAERRSADRVALALVALGVVLRLGLFLRDYEPTPDGQGYLALARNFSWLDPWAASYREPLWEAIVKAFGAPLGYSPVVLELLAVALSCTALIGAWLLARRVNGTSGAVALGVLAVHPILLQSVWYPGREAIGETLVVAFLWRVHERAWRSTAVICAVSFGIRWELGVAMTAVALVAVAFCRLPARTLAAVALGAAIVMGPFLVNSADHYGRATYFSDVHATFFRNLDTEIADTAAADRTLGHPDDLEAVNLYRGPVIGWGGYYLDHLGPVESVDRFVNGAVRIPWLLAANTWGGALLAVVTLGLAAAGVSRRHLPTVAMLGVVVAGYAALFSMMHPRLVSTAVIPLALLADAGAVRVRAALRPDLPVADVAVDGVLDGEPNVQCAGRRG